MTPSIETAVSELQTMVIPHPRSNSQTTMEYVRKPDVLKLAESWSTERKELERLERENTALRAMVVKHECPYGHRLPEGVCKLGYPGCACADDAACHEDETVRRIVEEKNKLTAELARARLIIRGLLMSSDCSWYEQRLGNDWKEAVDDAEAILSGCEVLLPPKQTRADILAELARVKAALNEIAGLMDGFLAGLAQITGTIARAALASGEEKGGK